MTEAGWKKGDTLRDYDRRMEDDAQAALLLEYAKKKQVRKKNNLFFPFKRKEKGL
ncbi:hypothetical protein [Robinsoniella sp. KNHs210]|uniref:hypothetical protein n=1 Tax=Robinsoniella sp. KNHs210 TaxID=1469950 RepID=UPI0012DDC321|nr:hypothetical protein [Robinsoniella sp. KNHs210]